MLRWLNSVFLRLGMITPWPFLTTTTSVTINVDNTVALPDEFESLIYIKKDGDWFLDGDDALSERDVFNLGLNANNTPVKPVGYTISNGVLTLHPTTNAGTGTLKYQFEMPYYTDSTDETIFPRNFSNLLERACLEFYYEYDLDERASMSHSFDAQELGLLLRWNNNQKSFPKRHPRGYAKERLT